MCVRAKEPESVYIWFGNISLKSISGKTTVITASLFTIPSSTGPSTVSGQLFYHPSHRISRRPSNWPQVRYWITFAYGDYTRSDYEQRSVTASALRSCIPFFAAQTYQAEICHGSLAMSVWFRDTIATYSRRDGCQRRRPEITGKTHTYHRTGQSTAVVRKYGQWI